MVLPVRCVHNRHSIGRYQGNFFERRTFSDCPFRQDLFVAERTDALRIDFRRDA